MKLMNGFLTEGKPSEALKAIMKTTGKQKLFGGPFNISKRTRFI